MSTADTVRAWFSERLANGPLARDTAAYNQVFAAIPDLIARLDPAPAPIKTAAAIVSQPPLATVGPFIPTDAEDGSSLALDASPHSEA
jgi:hypothetical protein